MCFLHNYNILLDSACVFYITTIFHWILSVLLTTILYWYAVEVSKETSRVFARLNILGGWM